MDAAQIDGCIPENTRDNVREPNSRWSCRGDDLQSSDGEDGCWIDCRFDDLQDIGRMPIAFHEDVKTLGVYKDKSYHGTIESNGCATGYQNFFIYTDETSKISLCLADYDSNSDVWLSLIEVRPREAPEY